MSCAREIEGYPSNNVIDDWNLFGLVIIFLNLIFNYWIYLLIFYSVKQVALA